MTFSYLLLLFILTPLLELALLMKLHEFVGLGRTVAIVIVTGFLGAALARSQGLDLLDRIREDVAEGRMPAPRLVDGIMILIAAALLITPGLITDVAGFLLLVPAFRGLLKKAVVNKLKQTIQDGSVRLTYHGE